MIHQMCDCSRTGPFYSYMYFNALNFRHYVFFPHKLLSKVTLTLLAFPFPALWISPSSIGHVEVMDENGNGLSPSPAHA